MEKTCDNCLFYVDAMPHVIICVGSKRTKTYPEMRKNCKKWVENTASNAKIQLELIKNEKDNESNN